MINTTTANTQEAARPFAVATDGSGSFVTAWESFNQAAALTWGVFGRMYDSAGVPQGGEFGAGTAVPLLDMRRPTVARRADGSFVMAWDSPAVLGATASIFAQQFNSDGSVQGSLILVSLGTIAQARTNASIAVDAGGDFIITWQSTNQDALGTSGVYARVYAPDGTAVTGETAVNVTTAGDQVSPVVAASGSGQFVVTWSGQGAGDSSGVFYRVFTLAGAAVTGERLVNTSSTAGVQETPAIAVAGGGVVIAWDGSGSGDAAGIFAQRYDSSFNALAGPIAVNTDTAGTQSNAAIASDPDGDLLIAWSGQGSADADGVYAREFASDGTARGAQVLVNTTVAGTQATPSVASLGDNSYVVVWSGAGSGDADGVFGRLFADDASVITPTPTALQYTENDPATAVDPGLTLSDSDSPTLLGATVAIASNYISGQDVLGFTNQSGIVGVWDPATGTLTLSGVASLAAYQTALRSVTYRNTSDNPSTLTRSVTFTVSDGLRVSQPATRLIAVTAVNDPPAVTTTPIALAFTENDPTTPVDPALTVSDVDNATLAGATIAITTNYVPGQDVLGFTNQSGIIGVWDPPTGTLTLTGVATLAAYQAALRSVTYSNTSDNPSTLTRSVAFVASDGLSSSPPASRSIVVTAVNDPPAIVTTPAPLAYSENDAPTAIDPALSVSDLDNATLVGATIAITVNYAPGEDVLGFVTQSGIVGVWDAATGTLSLSGVASLAAYQAALRSVTYRNTSESPSTLVRVVTFTASDGADSSLPATRSIALTAVNDPPLVTTTPAPLLYTENDPATSVDLGLTVSDVDSPTLSGATIVIASNYVSGQDVLGYLDQSGIVGTWDPATGTLTLSGVASLVAYQTALRSVTYRNTSDNPSVLPRSVLFTVSDGSALSPSASRTIAITAVNDPPVVTTTAAPLPYTENDAPTVIDAGLSVSDPDNAALIGATIAITSNYVAGQDLLGFTDHSGIIGVWNALNGTLTLTGAASLAAYQAALRSITYRNTSENPSELARTVTFTVSDGVSLSAPGGRTIAVTAVNDPPVLTPTLGPLIYVENSAPLAVDPGIGVADVDSATLTGATIAISGNYAPNQDVLAFTNQAGIIGVWDQATGRLTLTGVASVAVYQSALRSVTYRNLSDDPSILARTLSFSVSDGASTSAPVTRSIAVIGVNDPPVVAATPTPLLYTENDPATPVDSGLTIIDLDSPALTGATIAVSNNYVLGQDTLGFVDQFGIVGSWDPTTGVLTLSGVAPVASYQAALRSITYTNSSDDPSGLVRTISVAVSDGLAASNPADRNVIVVPINDAPVVIASPGPLFYTEGDGPVAVDPDVQAADTDSSLLIGASVTITGNYAPGQDALEFSDLPGIAGVWDPATGTLTLTGAASVGAYQAALRTIRYSNTSANPNPLTRTVRFAVTDDGLTTSAPALRSIMVTPLDSPPEVDVSGVPSVYTEGAPPVAIDNLIGVADPDSSFLVGATVTISGRYSIGQDLLGFADQLGITGVWDSATGVLTLRGAATVSNYEAALRTVTYLNTSEDPAADPRTISVTVDDGTSSSAPGIAQVLVVPIDNAPVVSASGVIPRYPQRGSPVLVDSGLTVSDADSTTLVGATIAIASNYRQGQDRLAFTDQGGIAGVWDPARGVLTLSGRATVGAYQVAIRSVTYVNAGDHPLTAPRSIAVTVSDGVLVGSAAISINVVLGLPSAPRVVPPDVPPVLPPDLPPITPPIAPPPPPPIVPPVVPPVVVPPVVPPVVPTPPPSAPPPTGGPTPPPTPTPPPAPPAVPPPPAQAAASTTQPAESPAAPGEGPAAPQVKAQEQSHAVPGGATTLAGELQRQLTIVLIEAGGTLVAGCVLWLLANYSVARHSLMLLPKFDPMDLHCLLVMASRPLRPAG